MKMLFSRIIKNIRKRWKLMLGLMVLLAVVGIIWYTRRPKPEELTFVSPERGELVKTLEVSGEIRAKQYAKLRFIAGGKVVYVGAQEGDAVKKWQTLATIDQRSLQKSLEKDLNNYESQRLDWDQTLDDTKDRWLPKSEERTKQQDQITLENSVIAVEATQISITNTVLSAPFDGILVHSPTNIAGVTILSTDTFDVVNPNTLIFQAVVDEVDISQVRIGQPVSIELDAFPDEQIPSHISYISYQSSESSNGTVFQVEFPLSSQTDLEKFRLGMNGDAIITIETKNNVLSVPLDTTFQRGDKTYVTVKTGDQTTEDREIETGMETEDRLEVMNGISDQDLIVLPE